MEDASTSLMQGEKDIAAEGAGGGRARKVRSCLAGSEESMTIGAVIGKEIGAGGRAQSGKFGGRKRLKIGGSSDRNDGKLGARSGEKGVVGSCWSAGRSTGAARGGSRGEAGGSGGEQTKS